MNTLKRISFALIVALLGFGVVIGARWLGSWISTPGFYM